MLGLNGGGSGLKADDFRFDEGYYELKLVNIQFNGGGDELKIDDFCFDEGYYELKFDDIQFDGGGNGLKIDVVEVNIAHKLIQIGVF